MKSANCLLWTYLFFKMKRNATVVSNQNNLTTVVKKNHLKLLNEFCFVFSYSRNLKDGFFGRNLKGICLKEHLKNSTHMQLFFISGCLCNNLEGLWCSCRHPTTRQLFWMYSLHCWSIPYNIHVYVFQVRKSFF